VESIRKYRDNIGYWLITHSPAQGMLHTEVA
jgi:hypothetical protein